MLTIQNVSRRLQVYNLDAASFQEMEGPLGYKLRHAVVVEHARSGVLVGRKLPRMLPESLTLLAGEVKSGLPNAVLDVESIKGAIERRELRIVSQTADEPESEPATEQKPSPPPPEVEKVKPTSKRSTSAKESA